MNEPSERKCPLCAEMVKAEAKRCKHCGADLTKSDFEHRADALGKNLRGCGCAMMAGAGLIILAGVIVVALL